MRGAQHDARRLARLECFLPAGSTEAPAIPWVQAWKAEFGHRGRKIIAARFGKLEKRGGHDNADGVTADILGPRFTAAVAEKACHRLYRADFEAFTEHVARPALAAAAITPVILPHCPSPCCRLLLPHISFAWRGATDFCLQKG
jgi:hypothetical protein